MFNKIGLAITFSPTGKALLKVAVRLQNLFNSQLVLIHIGDKNSTTEKMLTQMVENANLNNKNFEVIWGKGDPATSIIESASKMNVKLLIAGALEKEKFLKFYFGSVARKIMNEFPESSLILKSPSENPINFKKFFVSADYSHQDENTILKAFQFALLEKADRFVVIRDFYFPGLTASILDGGTPDKLRDLKEEWKKEELQKMDLFIKELGLQGMEIEIKCLYGREGFEAANFARSQNADIFVVTGPHKKIRFIDKLFPHNTQYSFNELPSNLLIIR